MTILPRLNDEWRSAELGGNINLIFALNTYIFNSITEEITESTAIKQQIEYEINKQIS